MDKRITSTVRNSVAYTALQKIGEFYNADTELKELSSETAGDHPYFLYRKKTGYSITRLMVLRQAQWSTAYLKQPNWIILRPYYYFKYILTELPKFCDEQENIDPEKLDYLMPWSPDLSDECKKTRRWPSGVNLLLGRWFDVCLYHC